MVAETPFILLQVFRCSHSSVRRPRCLISTLLLLCRPIVIFVSDDVYWWSFLFMVAFILFLLIFPYPFRTHIAKCLYIYIRIMLLCNMISCILQFIFVHYFRVVCLIRGTCWLWRRWRRMGRQLHIIFVDKTLPVDNGYLKCQIIDKMNIFFFIDIARKT